MFFYGSKMGLPGCVFFQLNCEAVYCCEYFRQVPLIITTDNCAPPEIEWFVAFACHIKEYFLKIYMVGSWYHNELSSGLTPKMFLLWESLVKVPCFRFWSYIGKIHPELKLVVRESRHRSQQRDQVHVG